MTGLTVCPGEDKTYDSVRLNQMAATRNSNSELNAKKVRRKKTIKIYDVFSASFSFCFTHSDTESGAKQLNRSRLS